ncbi:MAG TPA: non-ribosomal peptide synthetase [Pyrinomonadaceae bacterium]|jgi:amino acid adenylation domain-containing protein|nr:non-ribosomal peptide synthetase [Pyrinomonadaceae bacterium]
MSQKPRVADAAACAKNVALTSQSVGAAISARTAENPSAPAVVTSTSVLTYGELEQRANHLAQHLTTLGVGNETIVAVCLERSFESIISALAVLKAGGAYLPIDPKLPIERFNFIMSDAQPRVLITRSHASDEFDSSSLKVSDLHPGQPVSSAVKNDPLAYVIYTSGSTGKPKGVEITVSNLTNLIAWHQSEFKVTAADRASHLAAVGFDAGVWEVWPYLTAGASLFIPDECIRLAPEALRDWMVQNEITISFLPTTLAESLIDLKWPRETALRFLLTGADTLHRHPTQQLPFELVNNYGPTECTVVATSGRVRSGVTSELPSIGRPIANTSVYLLDENLREVTTGEVGQIYIGGANVGRGYLNNPQSTEEKFIRDPFNGKPDARMYRTGDLARRGADGDLAYVGRVDEQIKIHGYRIEPAEIEAAIDRHAAIAASVVVGRRLDCADTRLMAYVALKNGTVPAATELRDFLKSSLPEYMVPTLFVKIDSLPLTANGKIDRQALPAPDEENRLIDDVFVAPRTPIEQRVAEILCALFKVKEVGINDNFFLLGGHSLLGAQLLTKIRNAFGVDLPLRAVFDAPTIATLSATIEREIVARVESMTEAEAQALVA